MSPANSQSAAEPSPLRTSLIEELMKLDVSMPDGFLSGMVSDYLSQAAQSLSELGEAIAANDDTRSYQLAHRLKGSSGSMGAHNMLEPLQEIERLAKNGELSSARASLRRVQASYEQSATALRGVLEKLGRTATGR